MTAREIAICIAVGVTAFWYHGCESRRDGQLQEKIAGLEQQVDARMRVIAALVKEGEKIDTVYRVLRLAYKKDSAAFAQDTSPENARKLARGCSPVLLKCEEKTRNQQMIITNLLGSVADKDAIIKTERSRHDKRFGFGCAGPFSANTKGAGLGVGCGGVVRF